MTSVCMTRCVQVGYRLAEFRELVKEVVRSACRTALLEVGFTPDDYFYDGMDSPGLYQGHSLHFIAVAIRAVTAYHLKYLAHSNGLYTE